MKQAISMRFNVTIIKDYNPPITHKMPGYFCTFVSIFTINHNHIKFLFLLLNGIYITFFIWTIAYFNITLRSIFAEFTPCFIAFNREHPMNAISPP